MEEIVVKATGNPEGDRYSDSAISTLFGSHLNTFNVEKQLVWHRFQAMLLGNSILLGLSLRPTGALPRSQIAASAAAVAAPAASSASSAATAASSAASAVPSFVAYDRLENLVAMAIGLALCITWAMFNHFGWSLVQERSDAIQRFTWTGYPNPQPRRSKVGWRRLGRFYVCAQITTALFAFAYLFAWWLANKALPSP